MINLDVAGDLNFLLALKAIGLEQGKKLLSWAEAWENSPTTSSNNAKQLETSETLTQIGEAFLPHLSRKRTANGVSRVETTVLEYLKSKGRVYSRDILEHLKKEHPDLNQGSIKSYAYGIKGIIRDNGFWSLPSLSQLAEKVA